MRPDFKIELTSEPSLGDYLPFTITDGTQTMTGRLAYTALAVMGGEPASYNATFEANRSRIRDVVSKKLSTAIADEGVALTSYDFEAPTA